MAFNNKPKTIFRERPGVMVYGCNLSIQDAGRYLNLRSA